MSFEVLSWADDSLGQITRVGLEILCLSSVNPAFRPHVGPLLVPFPFFFPLPSPPLRSFLLLGSGPGVNSSGSHLGMLRKTVLLVFGVLTTELLLS